MKKSNIVYVEGYFARTDEEPVNRVAVLQQEKNELKKENAELRKDKEELCLVISECDKVCLHLKEQLAKAKELLNEFMRISAACTEDFEHDFTELIGETEQFLREIEK